MDEGVVTILDQIGLGTFLLLAIFIITTVTIIVEKIIKVLDKHKKKVLKENDDNHQIVSLTETVAKLTESVNLLDQSIEKINQRLDRDDDVINSLNESNDNTKRLITEQVIPQIQEMDKSVSDLIDSNQTDERSFIVNEYHKWMSLGYIDVYSLSVIQNKFDHYSRRGGNHFVADLVRQLYNLKSKPIIVDNKGNDPVNYFNKHPEYYPKFNENYQEIPSTYSDNEKK